MAAIAITSPAPVRAQGDERVAIQEVLDRRARAVRSADRELFASTLDTARTGFVERQMRLFENIQTVPLSAYRLESDWTAFGDLARSVERRRYRRADGVAVPLVRERYRLEGFDRRDVFQEHYLTFVKRSGRWLIAADDDLADAGLLSQRNLWDYGPVTTEQSANVMVLAPRCPPAPLCPTGVGTSLEAAEQARRRVMRYWSRDWSGKVPLLIPQTSDHLGQIIQSTFPLESFIAFAFWTGGAGGDPGARIIVNPDRAESLAARARSILTHELTHVAMLPAAGSFTPRFLDEGAAEFVRYEGEGSAVSRADEVARTAPGLPENWRFFLGDGSEIFRVYQRSLSAVYHFVDRFGWDRFEDLYVRLGGIGDEPGTARFHLDSVMRETTGIGLEDFEEDWASSIGAR